jgi:hypothetical protein
MISAVLFGGLVIAGALVRPDDATFGTVLIVASVAPLLHAVFAGVGKR